MNNRHPTALELVTHFIMHLIAYTICFAALFCVALVVSLFVGELELLNARWSGTGDIEPEFLHHLIIRIARAVEYSIFVIDVVVFLAMFIISSVEFIKELIKRR